MTATASPLLSIEGLASGYGDVQVLWGIDLDAADGGIVSIVGPNGSGKTTLLNAISGLARKRGGRVVFAGEDITGLGADEIVARGLIHVPEGRRLFRGLTVRDNLLLGAYTRRDGRAAVEADLEFVFTIFPILRDRQHQGATTMSGGEQQMCAIGRGIMAAPRLLMIDELSLGLAPKAVELLAKALVQIRARGITILLVEQDVMTAFEIADHGYVVESGRVHLSGPTARLRDMPEIRTAYMGM